ncbi:MAG: AAA family ATPase, partial [Planctomycetota bacterium]
MPLKPSKPPARSPRTAPPCGIAEVASRLWKLEKRLREIAVARMEAEDKGSSLAFEEDRALSGSRKTLKDELAASLENHAAETAAREKRLLARCRRREETVSRVHAEARKEILDRSASEIDARQKEVDAIKQRLADEQRVKSGSAAERQARFATDVTSLTARATELRDEVERLADRLSMRLEPVGEIANPDIRCDDDLESTAEETGKTLRSSTNSVLEFRRSMWCAAARGLYIGLAYFLLALIHVGGLVYVLDSGAGWRGLVVTFASLLAFGTIIHVLRSAARRRSASAMQRFHADVSRAVAHVRYLSKEGVERLDPDRFLDEHIDKTMAYDKQADAFRADRMAERKKVVDDLDRRHAKLERKIASRRDQGLKRLRSEASEAERRLEEQYRTNLESRETKHRTQTKETGEEGERTVARLREEWEGLLEEFCAFGRETTAYCRAEHPDWGDPIWRDRPRPVQFPTEVPVGTAGVELGRLISGGPEGFPLPDDDTVVLPFALSFPTAGSLFLQTKGKERDLALGMLHNAILRILTSFPPGMAKLTIADPVGLGQSFSALMRLADYDESLVANRIWTEAVHIERRLADLTEHIEKVIQKYLRNRYATIEEYNREAGEMTEAYQFLVIADFPTGFSELGLERLASILTSGPRCGVYTLIHHDVKQSLPSNIDISQVGKGGLVLRKADEGFLADRDGLRNALFSGEPPPPAELISELLEVIGLQAQGAKRVEVPFASAAPGKKKLWSLSSETGIRVPVGRAGADRLQHLDLGRGTAQHSLIGGRTGSGKSTLFHVMITNT